ncbi:PH domain-containing protein [Edwardsiella tarda]|uniref:PH domain-containing protein n=1 Tax=Edwardsiella tarda TaxID=636 RepID=UPI00351C63FE
MLNYKTATKEQLKEEFIRLSNIVNDSPFGTKKEFFHLPEILNSGETPLAVASGIMENNTWLITLTNQRVIFLDKGMVFGLKQVDVRLQDIVSVGGKTGLMFGEIQISTTGQNYFIKNVLKKVIIPFTNLINETRNNKDNLNQPAQHATTTHDDATVKLSFDEQMTKIERLADMRDEGILTDEEFQQQKQRILNS